MLYTNTKTEMTNTLATLADGTVNLLKLFAELDPNQLTPDLKEKIQNQIYKRIKVIEKELVFIDYLTDMVNAEN